jgi:hypothetical protein
MKFVLFFYPDQSDRAPTTVAVSKWLHKQESPSRRKGDFFHADTYLGLVAYIILVLSYLTRIVFSD